MIVQADAGRLPFPDQAFDLVIGSPPYEDARLYLEDGMDLGISRDMGEWVSWMLGVTAEALRVSRGLVIWVCAGVTRDWTYHPAPEGLLWEWVSRGGSAFRPVYWHRVGIPGSGGEQWFRADVEYCLAFKRPGKLPWADNTANGHAPKWAPGGEMSHRLTDGMRRNQWGGGEKSSRTRTAEGERQKPGRPSHKIKTMRQPDGSMEAQGYDAPDLANPGCLLHTITGGNQLGSKLAHENEAPYPVKVPAWFIASHCPPGGKVPDPFSGSGTTLDAATSLGRVGVGCDLRKSQCRLTRKRLANVTPGFAFEA